MVLGSTLTPCRGGRSQSSKPQPEGEQGSPGDNRVVDLDESKSMVLTSFKYIVCVGIGVIVTCLAWQANIGEEIHFVFPHISEIPL
jgi:hypothetical protein